MNASFIFVKVVQSGSFSEASRQLQMPVSTVSTKVSQLERELETNLLIRTTRKLNLTDAGRTYFEHALRAYLEMEEAKEKLQDVQKKLHGLIRMTVPVEMGSSTLPDLIAKFATKHKDLQIELILTDRVLDLVADGVDLAIRIGHLNDSSLIGKKVGVSGFQIYASPNYLKKYGEPKTPKDLLEHDCLLFHGRLEKELELYKKGRLKKIKVKGRLSANNLFVIHNLALNDQGIALLPRFLCQHDLKKNQLKQVLKDWSAEVKPVYFVYPEQKFVPRRIRALIDELADELTDFF